ncbi:MerR family transcriptional regulator [Patescibacteria group bacterium]|nr:MerR family transcriptional regulator [Patescibacteria group bacterium]
MKIHDSKPLFTISIAAELTDSHPRTLMLYEKRNITSPSRTETNRRLYSPDDIAKIKFVQYLTQTKGVNLAGVKMLIEVTKHCHKQNIDLKEILFSDYPTKIPF